MGLENQDLVTSRVLGTGCSVAVRRLDYHDRVLDMET
jgi:hypothetical protein